MHAHYAAPLFALALPGLLLLSGCPAPKGNEPGVMSSDDDDDEASTGWIEPDPDEPEMATTTTGAEESEEGGSFIIPPEEPPPSCDVWTQDCPGGEKCMPWANDGGNQWNDLKCVDITDNPAQPGDPCTVEGSGVTGLDNCDLGSMCWGVDGETNTGTCVAMCAGDQRAPFCEDPDASCVIVNDGVLTICLPSCDPVLQDCGQGEACYPVNGVFTCAPDASGPDQGVFGDPCEAINTCDVGLFCAPAEAVPNCQGSLGCCSDFCDLTGVDPDDDCSGAAEGQECLPAYEEGDVPPGGEHIGLCTIPAS